MIGALFHTWVYIPLYNGLVALLGVVPFGDVGMAVIALTILVKLVLFPISLKAARTQLVMKELEPELKHIRETVKDKQEQAVRTMALYKKNGVNPFSSVLLTFIQIPIIFGLYFVFLRGGLPTVHLEMLYSFVHAPSVISTHFLGFIDVLAKNPFLAALAGATQYYQAYLTLPKLTPRAEQPSMKDDISRSMQLQMRYFLPIMVTVIAYYVAAAVALYWVTSNIFAIGQELYLRRIRNKERQIANI